MNKFDFAVTVTIWEPNDTWIFPVEQLSNKTYHFRTTECDLAVKRAKRRMDWFQGRREDF